VEALISPSRQMALGCCNRKQAEPVIGNINATQLLHFTAVQRPFPIVDPAFGGDVPVAQFRVLRFGQGRGFRASLLQQRESSQ
jgi:hypothetical protein